LSANHTPSEQSGSKHLPCATKFEQFGVFFSLHAVAPFVSGATIDVRPAPGERRHGRARLRFGHRLRATSLRVRIGSLGGSRQPPPPAVRKITRSQA
jgi:hypothetical protein